MFISSFSIKNPTVTIVTTLLLLLFGGLALYNLQTDEFPEVQEPFVSVVIPYPGAAPETVEREVVERLEEAFQSIPGVLDIMSTSMDSVGFITLKFDFGKNIQRATQDVRDKISEKRQDLPREMREPSIHRYDLQQEPIVIVNLVSSKLTPVELTRLAESALSTELRSVPGVADIKVVGGAKRELAVEVRPGALRAVGLTASSIVDALADQNLAAPVGRLQDHLQERSIRLRGRLQSIKEFENLVVFKRGDQLVRLGEVARITDAAEEVRSVAYYNEQVAIALHVIKSSNSSTTAVASAALAALKKVQPQLPHDVEIKIVHNSAEYVGDSIDDLRNTLFEGAFLTIVVVFAFLNSWRSTIITGLALPVSVIASFIAVWALGYTLNQMSLLGLSLAIGILVDDAIVVRENIVRHMEMGRDQLAAALEGTDEIGLAVAATTFAIVAVFVPVAVMGGQAQQWLAPFALTVAFSVLISLFVSFSLDPMLSAYWPSPRATTRRAPGTLRSVFAAFNRWLDARTAQYRALITWSLSHRLFMVSLAVLTLIVAAALPAAGLVQSEFIPATDDSGFSVKLETPAGSSLNYTRLKLMEVVRRLRATPEVLFVTSSIGDNGSVDEGNLWVTLVKRGDRQRTQQAVINEIRHDLAQVSGLRTSIADNGSESKPIQIGISGPDSRVLQQVATDVARAMRSVPNCVDLTFSTKDNRPELELNIDREFAGALGISVSDIARALQPAFAGVDAGDWVDPTGVTRDVTVRMVPEDRANSADIETLPVFMVGNGKQIAVPLGQVVKVRPGFAPTIIKHFNRQRGLRVLANTNGRPLSEVIGPIKAKLADISIPPGYKIRYGGADAGKSEFFSRTLLSIAVAVVLMYFILVIQFSSFVEPLAIIASLPLSSAGVMLALYFTNSTLNLMSMIGIVLLVGLVAKNAILLVDFAKRAEQRGIPRAIAIADAGAMRLRPILMTSLTVIVGMVPVAVGAGEGSEFRAPLGQAVIGGVVTSTLLTLLVIPTVYEMLTSARDRALSILRRDQGFQNGI